MPRLSSLVILNAFSCLCLLNSSLFALNHRRFDGHQVEDHLKMEILEELEQSGGNSYEPLFVMTERNVKAPSGGSAYLRCRILQLGDRTVSWVRQADLQILTAGNYTYTSDKRFRALHSPMTNDWTLELRESRVEDSGVYECQIPSSHDNKLSLSVSLQVMEMVTEIQEGPVVLIRQGYDVKLRCLINFVPDDMSSSYVFWFRDKKMLNYDTSRSSVTTTKTVNGSSGAEVLLSELVVQNTDHTDSGNYSCLLHAQNIDPAHSHPAHVQVLVLDKSEYASAIQGLSSKDSDGSRVHPAKSWSAAAPLSSNDCHHATLLLLLGFFHSILIRLGLR